MVVDKMAGVLAPIYTHKFWFRGQSECYITNPSRSSPRCFFTFQPISPFALNSITMAQAQPRNNSPEIKEPTPKIQKIDENGFHPTRPTHFFRVKKLSEKAILPSRGSPLSAGYDLSRYTFSMNSCKWIDTMYVYVCVCNSFCCVWNVVHPRSKYRQEAKRWFLQISPLQYLKELMLVLVNILCLFFCFFHYRVLLLYCFLIAFCRCII